MNWTNFKFIWAALLGGMSFFTGNYIYDKYKDGKAYEKDNNIQSEKLLYTANETQERIKYEKERQFILLKWRELITVEKSGGKHGGIFGGFEDVTIRVKNDTDYKLDNVVIGVFIYRGINENKQCHYEPLLIQNIPANAEKSIKYTHTECGQKLDAIIQGANIEKLDIHIDTAIE